MAAFFLFVIKSAFVLALLVPLFMIFMSRETFHKTNRFILLSIVCVALLLPAFNLGIESPFSGIGSAVEEYFAWALGGSEILVDTCYTQQAVFNVDELAIGATGTLDLAAFDLAEEEPFDWLLFATVIYFAGVAVLVVRQLVMYFQVVRVIIDSRVVDAQQYACNAIRLCVHRRNDKPFSWFRWVVVSEGDLDEGAREIIIHETAHARAGHSWDIMFADAVIILQWFNPLAWIMKNCLKDIHEFEADEAVIASGVNVKQYQMLIIKKAVGARLYSIANSFNHSLTKKRITMMCKEKSKKWRCAKALYIVPAAAIAALTFTSVETANATENETLVKGNEIVVNNARDVVENYTVLKDYTAMPLFPADAYGEPVDVCTSVNFTIVPSVSADDDEKVFQVCEKAPEFPGGANKMYDWLAKNIKYPAEAEAAGKEGRVFVQFIVKKDGSIIDAEIVRSSGDESLDKEAVRVITSMPNWNPGRQSGKPVNVKYTLPIIFRLQESTKEQAKEQATESFETLTELGDKGSVPVPNADDAAIVIDGALYEGAHNDIKSEDIESVTVMSIDKLSGEELEKCKALGKKKVIYIEMKKHEFSVLGGSEAVFTVCEKAPEFPGGTQELMKLLSVNLRYPKAARDINAQGKVYVNFVVMADGSISNIRADKLDFTSKFYEASAAEELAKDIERHKFMIADFETDCKEFEQHIAEYERKLAVLEKDNAPEVVLNRRREELADARRHWEEEKVKIVHLKRELGRKELAMIESLNELDEIIVTAYKNEAGEALSAQETLALREKAKRALVDEALRVVKSLPEWTPGMQNGKNVNVQLTLPIQFRLK